MEKRANYFKPAAFWSWNGRLTEKGVRRQVREFAEAGFGGFFVHARGGLKCTYFSEEWFHLFGAAADEAAQCGLDVWIYDENGWPSGFGGGRVNGRGRSYHMKRLRPGVIPGAEETIRSGGYVLSVMEEKGYVDLLDPAVTEAFLQEIHEEYGRRFGSLFGGTIKGVFTDEPQLDNGGGPYSAVMPQEFGRRRGYPLLPELYKLFYDVPGAEKFRLDYFKTVQELFAENYTERIARWCGQNGLIFTGHFPCEDGLCFQPSVTGGVMRHYRAMQMPGVDHLGRRYNSPVLLKQLSSVCSLYGKPFALSETFGGAGYGVSFAELAHIWAYQAALGVNFCCLHLAAYTVAGTAKRDYPPVFSYQQPWYEAASALSNEIGAVSRFVSEGEDCHSVLLVSALGSARICRLESAEQRFVSSEFRATVENLIAVQIPFDIADEEFLSEACVSDGRILLGKNSYSLLLLPYMLTVEEDTFRLASAFAAQGGKVFYIGTPPEFLAGVPDKSLAKEYIHFTPVANRCGYFRKVLEYTEYSYAARLMEPSEGKTAEKIVVSVRRCGVETRLLAVNTDLSSERLLTAEFEGEGEIYLRSLRSGMETRLGSRACCGKTYADVRIPVYGYVALVFRGGREPSREGFLRHIRYFEETTLHPVHVVREGDNSLVIDHAFCSVDGFVCEYGIEELRDIVFGAEGDYTIRYCFTADCIPSRLRICAETGGQLILNGIPLSRCGTAVDRDLPLFDALPAVRKGENVVELRVSVARTEGIGEESFETLKNIFSYSSDVENLILYGDFSVAEYTRAEGGKDRVFSAAGPFRIVQTVLPAADDFTEGAPFYAGNVRVCYEYETDLRKGRILLSLSGYHAAAARVYVNGREVETFVAPPAETDIFPLLRKGKNTIEILYFGHLRNLFGPFHHYKGDPAIAAPECFSGRRGFADSYTNPGENTDTSVKEYNFVCFGGGYVRILREEE